MRWAVVLIRLDRREGRGQLRLTVWTSAAVLAAFAGVSPCSLSSRSGGVGEF